jgi:hypothetical protein
MELHTQVLLLYHATQEVGFCCDEFASLYETSERGFMGAKFAIRPTVYYNASRVVTGVLDG